LLEGLEELEDNPTLEMENEDLMDFNYDEEKFEISLHAITGNNHPNTMSLIGWIGSHKIIVSVDNGSTHNFLDSSSVGKKLKVSISREQRIKVKVTNGEEVVSEGKCMQIEVQLQKFYFTTDAYMIMLASCDMVLGIQWLVSLGSIIWNFKVLTMKFTIANHTFLSQGLITPYLREELMYKFNCTRQLHESIVVMWLCKCECRTHRESALSKTNFKLPKLILSQPSPNFKQVACIK
jgi:hypothetical protein